MILGTVISFDPHAELMALPFCFLWIAAPFIIHVIDKPLDKRIDENLSDLDKKIRKIDQKFEKLGAKHGDISMSWSDLTHIGCLLIITRQP